MNIVGWALGGLLCIPLVAAGYNTWKKRVVTLEGVLSCAPSTEGGFIVRFTQWGRVLAEMPVRSSSHLNPVVQQLRELSEVPSGIIVERELSGDEMVDAAWWVPKQNEM